MEQQDRAKTLFDLKQTKARCFLEVLWVITRTTSTEREREDICSSIPTSLTFCDMGDFYLLEIGQEHYETYQTLLNSIDQLGSSTMPDGARRHKEMRVWLDIDAPLSLTITEFSSWKANWLNNEGMLRIVLPRSSANDLFNGFSIQPLDCRELCLENVTALKTEEDAFLQQVMQRQTGEDWILPPARKADVSPSNDILQEVRSLFGANDVIGFEELKIIRGSDNSREELDSLFGIENIKQEIRKLEARLSYIQRMEQQGYYFDDTVNLHMCFLGAPGTGKTTVARIITGMLYQYGYVKKNKCIEINARQLVGGYVGQTGSRTAKIIQAARGGVLFIDEAYTLVPDTNSNNDFSHEAVAQLLKDMEDYRGELIVILAGYEKDMEHLFDMNEGLRSRINRNILFANYSAVDTMEIFLSMLRREQYRIDYAALKKLFLLMKECCRGSRFANGRFVRNLFEAIYEFHAYRLSSRSVSVEERDTIVEADIDDNDVCRPMRDSAL